MKEPLPPAGTVEFIRIPPPPHCSKHAVILVEKGLAVTPYTITHYSKLLGRTLTEIRFETYDGQPLPVLVFSGGTTAAVFCDPEGNGPGHLDIEQSFGIRQK
jgi:hypothetical protein